MPQNDIFQKTVLHSRVKYAFGTKRCSSGNRGVFMEWFFFNLPKIDHFWGFNEFLNK